AARCSGWGWPWCGGSGRSDVGSSPRTPPNRRQGCLGHDGGMAEAPLAGCAATRSRRDGFGSGFQPRLDAGLFERGVVLDGVVDPGVVDVIDAVGAVDA